MVENQSYVKIVSIQCVSCDAHCAFDRIAQCSIDCMRKICIQNKIMHQVQKYSYLDEIVAENGDFF